VDYEVEYPGYKEQLSERTFISFPLSIPSAFFSLEIKVDVTKQRTRTKFQNIDNNGKSEPYILT
jgi:hypothetical protein